MDHLLTTLCRPVFEWRLLCGRRWELLLRLPSRFRRGALRGRGRRVRQPAMQERCRVPGLRQQLCVRVPSGLRRNPVWTQHPWMHWEVSHKTCFIIMLNCSALLQWILLGRKKLNFKILKACVVFLKYVSALQTGWQINHYFLYLLPPSSCLNNGTCIDDINTFSCRCRPGFYGTFCEYEKNECDSQPCKNGGTCTDGLGTYRCTCPVGYNGQNCQVKCTEQVTSVSWVNLW